MDAVDTLQKNLKPTLAKKFFFKLSPRLFDANRQLCTTQSNNFTIKNFMTNQTNQVDKTSDKDFICTSLD